MAQHGAGQGPLYDRKLIFYGAHNSAQADMCPDYGRLRMPQQKFFHLLDEVGLLVRLWEWHVDVVVHEDGEPNLPREV